MRIKLKDIAERANVSTATVSRVLNNNPNVDERTRDHVVQTLQEIGYPLPGVKRTVETTRSITIALNSPTGRATSYIGTIVDGIEEVVRQQGFQVQIVRITTENPKPEELEQLSQVENAIIIGGAVQPHIFDLLEQERIPFVLAAAHRGEREINCVHGNYLQATAHAIQTLAGMGHRRIALVNGPMLSTTSHDKLTGYKLGLVEAGLAFDEAYVAIAEGFNSPAGQTITHQLWESCGGFSAILYATDGLAIGGLSTLKELGLEVPRDVSLIGFYDEPFAPFMDPPLSSITVDWRRIGVIAAHRMLNLVEQRDKERLHIVIPAHLVLRGSVASYTDALGTFKKAT